MESPQKSVLSVHTQEPFREVVRELLVDLKVMILLVLDVRENLLLFHIHFLPEHTEQLLTPRLYHLLVDVRGHRKHCVEHFLVLIQTLDDRLVSVGFGNSGHLIPSYTPDYHKSTDFLDSERHTNKEAKRFQQIYVSNRTNTSMSELWDEPEERFQRLVDTLWYIAEKETDGDHIQAVMNDLGELYKWYDGTLRPQSTELTPTDTRVSKELAREYNYDRVLNRLQTYEGMWIPEADE